MAAAIDNIIDSKRKVVTLINVCMGRCQK